MVDGLADRVGRQEGGSLAQPMAPPLDRQTQPERRCSTDARIMMAPDMHAFAMAHQRPPFALQSREEGQGTSRRRPMRWASSSECHATISLHLHGRFSVRDERGRVLRLKEGGRRERLSTGQLQRAVLRHWSWGSIVPGAPRRASSSRREHYVTMDDDGADAVVV